MTKDILSVKWRIYKNIFQRDFTSIIQRNNWKIDVPKTFDLTLIPLYRLRGNELPSPPGLLALTPPRRKARSRGQDRLIVHLSLSGNAPFSTVNYLQMTSRAAEEFYQTPGSVTSALRAAATTRNGDLLERNMASSGQGRYSLAQLVLGVIRGEQFYLLQAGPTHVYWISDEERDDIYAPDMAGRGLGLGQSTNFYLSQFALRSGGRLLIAPKLSSGWTQILQRDNQSASLETMRSVLMRQSMEDHNAVLVEFQEGRGDVATIKPPRIDQPTLESVSQKIDEEPQITPNIQDSHQPEPQPVSPPLTEDIPAAAPRLDNESKPPQERPVFDSIPRKAPEPIPDPEESDIFASIPRQMPEEIPAREEVDAFEVEIEEEEIPTGPPAGEVIAREGARAIAKGMQATREGNNRLKDLFTKMLPRLLPASDSETPVRLPTWVMGLIAVIIPLVVVTIASVVYFRFGRDIQYETYFAEAETLRTRAMEQDDPVAQRIAWEDTITKLNQAEEHDSTPSSRALREEAQSHLDDLLGVIRLAYQPAVNELPRGIEISAMTANDKELFILDSAKGEILRAFLTDSGFQFDDTFNCRGGDYGEATVGSLVELLTLPAANAMAGSVLGIDNQGNLLYCAANQVSQAISLQQPPIGFKEITAAVLDADVLYLLDAPSREVWVYSGQASTFINYPTAFFENAPQGLESAVDMSIKGNELYLLFTDGHLANCTYSLLDTVPTRCTKPAQLSDPHPAAGGGNNFGQVLFTQMELSTPPDSALLLFAPKSQAVFRFSPRSFELQNQLHPIQDFIPSGTLDTMTTNTGHSLFIAQGDKIYMAADTP